MNATCEAKVECNGLFVAPSHVSQKYPYSVIYNVAFGDRELPPLVCDFICISPTPCLSVGEC